MKLPIPDTPSQWRCYRVYWPDSLLWDGLLRGMFTQWARGRLWDGNTGNIKDTQAYCQQIADKNIPFNDCDDCHDCNECAECVTTVTDWIDGYYQGIEDTMRFITDLKCENGYLWMLKDCEWVQVCPLPASAGGALPPDIEPPDIELRRCNKAYWIVNRLMWHFAETADAMTDSLDIPPAAWALWLSRNSTIGVNYATMMNLFQWFTDQPQQDLYATADGMRSEWFCDLARRIEDTAQYTQVDIDAIGSSIDYVFSGDTNEALHRVFETLTYSQMTQWSAEGAFKTDAPCDDCTPETPPPQLSYSWSYKWDFTVSNGNWLPAIGYTSNWITGRGWADSGNEDASNVDIYLGVNTYETTLMYCRIEAEAGAFVGTLPQGYWGLYWPMPSQRVSRGTDGGTVREVDNINAVIPSDKVIRLKMETSHPDNPQGNFAIRSLIIAGNGLAPFPTVEQWRP